MMTKKPLLSFLIEQYMYLMTRYGQESLSNVLFYIFTADSSTTTRLAVPRPYNYIFILLRFPPVFHAVHCLYCLDFNAEGI